ncbi:SphA family protein [Beggiatoa leptomitoformis]|uniref:Transporter n=1 Tax=Beggiatoa leptomitoformis TaxID=288004 RepID=A0A2N9YC77_9GAMM|nr:transporter [Beggiatoa leptomitoformis]ALG66611.1 transporter [Beggiatoa leptomitoformis]AUI68078.1 transporter [Beggiatoa leptomitoformis]
MNNRHRIAVLLYALLLHVPTVFAEHYVNGVEGLKAASVPPAGFYYRLYNVFYNADSLMDGSSNELPVDFDVSVYAMANRFIWITEQKILGADYGMNVILPLINTDISIGALGVDDSDFALGDVLLEPIILSWHESAFDAVTAAGVYIPSGNYDVNQPASASKGYWTGLLTAGVTYYADPEKTWSASILSRYEFHGKQDDTNITAGDDFHFEWGVGKTIEGWDVGLVGYNQWQVTEDSGEGASTTKDRIGAIGAEVGTFIPSLKTAISFRALQEYQAKDRSEGSLITLTLTKIF